MTETGQDGNKTGKEIILKAIRRERPGRTPVVILSGGAWTFNSAGYTLESVLGRPELMASVIAETYRWKAPSDAIWVGSGFNNLPAKALGGELKFPAKGTPQVVESLFAKPSEIEQIDLKRIDRDPDVLSLWATTRLVDQEIGNRTLIGASGWGPFTLAAQLYGTEKLMSQIYKDRQAVLAVLEFGVEASLKYYKGFIKNGARIISIGEPTASGDMISRRHFEQFALPAITRFMGRMRAVGALNLLHICGNIMNRLDLIPESGADILSVDYKVDLRKVREIMGGRIAFAGNVNPVTIGQASPADVAQACRDCLQAGGKAGNFILMPGCDLPPSAPLANVRRFIQEGQAFGAQENERRAA